MKNSELLAIISDGRKLPVEPCHCGACDNEWFMVAISDEWMPSFCPYCGVKFHSWSGESESEKFSPNKFNIVRINTDDDKTDN